jgi:alpha-1,2-rhamnosyltransferase
VKKVVPSGQLEQVAGDKSPPRKLFIDCTQVYRSNLNTGIQRAVRNILRHASSVGAKHGMDVILLALEDNHFVMLEYDQLAMGSRSGKFLSRNEARAAYIRVLQSVAIRIGYQPVSRFLQAPITRFGFTRLLFYPYLLGKELANLMRRLTKVLTRAARPLDLPAHGNVLLLLDSSWNYPIWGPALRFKAAGGIVIGVVYDIIPITHPHFFEDALVLSFRTWWEQHFQTSDALIAISQFVKNEIHQYAGVQHESHRFLRDAAVGYFYLGSEICSVSLRHRDSKRILKMFAPPRPTFLMVGSIEPRKNHGYVLDAFEQLWAAGNAVRLVIVGHQAWGTGELLLRIQSHQRFGSDLFLLRDVTDDELELCYQKSHALIMSSMIEGFGLPIVEAFQRGLPVLCSDIPVFREIAEGNAWFFGLDNPAQLANIIRQFVVRDNNAFAGRAKIPWPSWRQSTENLFESICEIVGRTDPANLQAQ